MRDQSILFNDMTEILGDIFLSSNLFGFFYLLCPIKGHVMYNRRCLLLDHLMSLSHIYHGLGLLLISCLSLGIYDIWLLDWNFVIFWISLHAILTERPKYYPLWSINWKCNFKIFIFYGNAVSEEVKSVGGHLYALECTFLWVNEEKNLISFQRV